MGKRLVLGLILKSLKVYFVALDPQDVGGQQAVGSKAMMGWFAFEM